MSQMLLMITTVTHQHSVKILRGMMAKIANGEPYKISPTIEDESMVEILAPQILDLVDKKIV